MMGFDEEKMNRAAQGKGCRRQMVDGCTATLSLLREQGVSD
jgi:hypothetical protein